MSKRQGSQTVTQTPDRYSQNYIQGGRNLAREASGVVTGAPGSYFASNLRAGDISAAMNPYISNVIDATRGEFDFMRGQASLAENARATGAGAFGGDRHGLAMGARLGELDRSQASTIAGLLHGGYGQGLQLAEHRRQLEERALQEPLWRYGQGLNFLNLGMGPVGTQSVQTSEAGRNPLGSAIGGATAGSAFGPWGAAIGGGIGLLGSFL